MDAAGEEFPDNGVVEGCRSQCVEASVQDCPYLVASGLRQAIKRPEGGGIATEYQVSRRAYCRALEKSVTFQNVDQCSAAADGGDEAENL